MSGYPRRPTRSTPPRRPRSQPRPTWVSARPQTTAATANTRRAAQRSPTRCKLADDKFALRGRWTLDDQGATADSDDAAIALNYTAKAVYAVVGGTGTLTVTRDGKTTTTPILGPPTLHQVVNDDTAHRDRLDMQVSKGLQVFSFTFG